MSKVKTIFSMNLKYQRELKNVTQRYMAEKLCVDRTTYSRWENGIREPSTDSIMTIADTLEIPIEELFARGNKEKERKAAAGGA